MQFSALSDHLHQLLNAVESEFANKPLGWWDDPYAPGKWQRRQLAGHLVDSAANNHQRFVRSILATAESKGPGYDQEGCVRVQRFDTLPIPMIIGLLLNYNRLIAHIFANFPQDKLATPCHIGDYPAMAIETVALSYVAHLEHHFRQLAGTGTLQYSGLPWPWPE